MVFSSYEFLLVFLPISFLGFLVLEQTGWGRLALAWVVLASLVFYGWWNPIYLPLLAGSMLGNFAIGRLLTRRDLQTRLGTRKALVVLGVSANLLALGYFKYAGLLATTVEGLGGVELGFASIELPLAISFFTFQQIAYLVDAYRGTAPAYGALQYAFFISFFPQLIAGPIVRHDQTIPQLERLGRLGSWSNLAIGATILTIGLAKKVILADGVATYATPVFGAAARGVPIGLYTSWTGALAYTLQIYFDFSGYTDMAIGCARLFGIRLPLNFDSPYRATSISDFWRRWHITLSSFLRDYLYIPLGGNRHGEPRRYANLMLTMLIGGLWHGAGWAFVLWGGLHGLYLVVDHVWSRLRRGARKGSDHALGRAGGWVLTFLAVLFAWVLFRAETLSTAIQVYQGMLGAHGIGTMPGDGYGAAWQVVVLIALLALACLGPNTQELLRDYEPALDYPKAAAEEALPTSIRARWPRMRLRAGWAIVLGMLAALSMLYLERSDEFLYFQF